MLYGAEIKAAVLMTWWNSVQKRDSLLADCGLDLSIPGGLSTPESDWFPLVMNFYADQGFSAWMGDQGLRLTVLYNFPAYDPKDHCSRLYDPQSPYYNSFYGAYLVRSGGEIPFGFKASATDSAYAGTEEAMEVDPEAVSKVPFYDYQKLVLADFGLREEDFIFDWKVNQTQSDLIYAGSSGWTRLDADLQVSGACHRARPDIFSYMQYGKPAEKNAEDFSPASMKGRIYARYFPDQNVSVFFYIVASDEEVLKACDRKILSRSRISAKQQ